jgi:hypothetical protein
MFYPLHLRHLEESLSPRHDLAGLKAGVCASNRSDLRLSSFSKVCCFQILRGFKWT